MDLLISPAYRAEQVRLHGCGYYGAYSDKWIPFVVKLTRALNVSTVLDYGCGQGKLVNGLRAHGIHATGYDPAVPPYQDLPDPSDLVFCSDVLEHIEPDRLDRVLDHLHSVTKAWIYVVIATRPATRWLSDGRNAHLIIEPPAWWRHRLQLAGWVEHGWIEYPCVYDPTLEMAGLWQPGART